MKAVIVPILAVLTTHANAAILAGYNFDSGSGAVSSSDPGATAGDMVPHGSINNINRPVIYPNPNGNGWAGAPTSEVVGTGGTPGTEANSVAGNDHFSFQVTPVSGFALNLTQLDFSTAFHSSGTFNLTGWYFVRSSVDNYATTIGGSIFQESHVNSTDPTFTQRTVDLTGASFQNLTSEVTFRIYLYDNSNSTERWVAIDEVNLQGTADPIPEPASAGLLLPCVAFFPRRRR